jgi:hypothetical protein
MYPVFRFTASNQCGIYEEGGLIQQETGPIKGYAKLVCSEKGRPKRPIYVFQKREFNNQKNHMKSLLFEVKPNDWVISVAVRGITEKIPGIITIALFKIMQFVNDPNNKKPSTYKAILKHTFSYSFPMGSSQGSEMLDLYNDKRMAQSKYLLDKLFYKTVSLDLEYLGETINCAITKANSTETSYSYFKNAPLTHEHKYGDVNL